MYLIGPNNVDPKWRKISGGDENLGRRKTKANKNLGPN